MFSLLAGIRTHRAGIIGSIAGAGLLVAVVLGYVFSPGNDDTSMTEKADATAKADAAEKADATEKAPSSTDTTADTPADPLAPQFLLARVDPEGNLVLTGTAVAGAEVTIREGETVLGTAEADSHGEWVFVSDTPLPPGEHVLSLIAKEADGTSREGAKTLVVVIPEPGKDITGAPLAEGKTGDRTPLVMLMPHDPASGDASKILQAPDKDTPAKDAPAKDAQAKDAAPAPDTDSPPDVSIGVIDYNDKGEVIFSGTAKPSSTVRVYVDNEPIGETGVDAERHWTLTPETLPAGSPIEPGPHRVRVDAIDAEGKVYARIEVPFIRADPFRILPDGRVVIVQPGASLWRIATRIYGSGVRYTDIYKANADQIRDPHLIYPGQVFGIPPSN